MPRLPLSPTARALVALVVGLAAGVGVAQSGHATPRRVVAAIEPLGTLWVNAIRMTVVPLVVSLLFTRIASTSSRAVGRTGGRALGLFVAFSAAAGVFALLAAPPLLAGVRLDGDALAALRSAVVMPAQAGVPPFRDWLTALAPPNPVRAAEMGLVAAAIPGLSLYPPGSRAAACSCSRRCTPRSASRWRGSGSCSP